MQRHLLLLRHAKSAWDTDAPTDFERPLAKRGKRDAPRMGQWMQKQGLVPDFIISSPATRATQTASRVCKEMGMSKRDIHFDERIYAADEDELLAVLADCPKDRHKVMMVGHNPGLADLLAYLWGDKVETPPDGNLMPTATLAHLKMPGDWSRLSYGAGHVMSIVRPRSLPEVG